MGRCTSRTKSFEASIEDLRNETDNRRARCNQFAESVGGKKSGVQERKSLCFSTETRNIYRHKISRRSLLCGPSAENDRFRTYIDRVRSFSADGPQRSERLEIL